MSGSAATRFKKRVIDAGPSSKPASKLTSIMPAPASTCCLAILSADLKSPASISSRNFLEPATLLRSPMLTNELAPPTRFKGSNPAKRSAAGGCGLVRGGYFATRWRIAAMCAGVVPQQPPTMFTKPSRAKLSKIRAVSSGPSGKPVGDNGFGRPALG